MQSSSSSRKDKAIQDQREEENNDGWGGGGTDVTAAKSFGFVLVCVRVIDWLCCWTHCRTCVDLPSFLDRFLAATEFVRRITDDEY